MRRTLAVVLAIAIGSGVAVASGASSPMLDRASTPVVRADFGAEIPPRIPPLFRWGHTAIHSSSSSPLGVHTGPVDWDAVAFCESHDQWDINSGNGYWGGLQFAPGTWFANGGGPFDGIGWFPYSRAEQIAVAERLYAVAGLAPWPVCGRLG